MRLRELSLSQFRNWTYDSFEFHPSLQYIRGPNGSGKTSVLEAIHYLSQGKSTRAQRDRECIQHDRGSFSIRGTFEEAPFESVSVQYSTDSGKVARIDDDSIPRLSQLQERVATMMFAADDLLTLKQGPEGRRRFMNEVLSRTTAGYVEHLRQYQKALEQRNSLLKKPDSDDVLLSSVEETMAEHARPVMETRSQLFPLLHPLFIEEHDRLAPESTNLELSYKPDVGDPDSILSLLREERDHARRRGYTTMGPQRDDWTIRREGRSVGSYGSQGELRTLVFALKFAVARRIMEAVDQCPILLFDDMLSDLDADRCERAISVARDHPFQLIFTGTRSLAESLGIDREHRIDIRVG